jgi:hypothetical protein
MEHQLVAQKVKLTKRQQLIAWVAVFAVFFLSVGLWKLGVLNSIGKKLVDKSLNQMQKVNERQQSQPKTVVMKDGRKIVCKEVKDQGPSCGLVQTDGKFSAVKKEDVQAIIDGAQPDASPRTQNPTATKISAPVQQSEMKVVVMKDGRRIECTKMNDQGQFWGLVLTDRKFSAVKKEDVKEIVDATPTPTAKE